MIRREHVFVLTVRERLEALIASNRALDLDDPEEMAFAELWMEMPTCVEETNEALCSILMAEAARPVLPWC